MSEVENKKEKPIQSKVKYDSKSILTISAPGGMHIRIEPNVTSDIVRVANHKEVLEVISYTKSWIKVEDGWILNLPYGCVIKQE